MKRMNGNLCLTRKLGEVICLGNDTEIEVVRIQPTFVRLVVRAPKDVLVLRGELKDGEMLPRPAGETVQ